MSSRYGWVVVAAGAFITGVAMSALFALPIYVRPMLDDTGWTGAGISGARSLNFLVMGIASLGWGLLYDRIGARIVLATGSLLLGAGLLMASQAPDALAFQLAYGIVAGTAAGALSVPLVATVIGWFERHRAIAVSLVMLGGGVAQVISAPGASLLIEAFGWRSAMAMTAIGAMLLLLPASFLVRPARAAVPASRPVQRSTRDRTALSALRTPQFIILALSFFFFCAAESGPMFHTASYVMSYGAPALVAASIISVGAIAGLFGRILLGLAGDRFGTHQTIVAGLVVHAIALCGYVQVSELWHFYLLAVVLGPVYGGLLPLYTVLARDYFDQRVMGAVLGAVTTASSVGLAIGPILGGWISDSFGSLEWLYLASALIGSAAALMAVALPVPRGQGEPYTGAPRERRRPLTACGLASLICAHGSHDRALEKSKT